MADIYDKMKLDRIESAALAAGKHSELSDHYWRRVFAGQERSEPWCDCHECSGAHMTKDFDKAGELASWRVKCADALLAELRKREVE